VYPPDLAGGIVARYLANDLTQHELSQVGLQPVLVHDANHLAKRLHVALLTIEQRLGQRAEAGVAVTKCL
jgi:hypothetical protein